MSKHNWPDDLVSDFPDIDAQYKKLFEVVDTFVATHDESVPNHTLLAFLDDLLAHCEAYFASEERSMAENAYPLIDYHVDLHDELILTIEEMQKQIISNALDDAFVSVFDFTQKQISEHVIQEDLAFFSFYKNKDNQLSQHLLGQKCELLTMNDALIGNGKIESIHNNEVVIAYKADKMMPVDLSDIVKVTSFSARREKQVFIARVYDVTPTDVKLFDATLLQDTNNRQFFRVPIRIEATLRLKENMVPVVITDLSLGGLMIETDIAIENGTVAALEFTMHNHHMIEVCKITRIIKEEAGAPFRYGAKFLSLDSGISNKISSFVFSKQTSERQKRRDTTGGR